MGWRSRWPASSAGQPAQNWPAGDWLAARRNIWQSGTLKEQMSIPRQSIHAVPDPVSVPDGDENGKVHELAPAQQDAQQPGFSEPQQPRFSERDVRAKRPPVLSFLLRWETARRLTRVLVLMALDFAGVFLAIFTALLL
jgi:hypothetical protein